MYYGRAGSQENMIEQTSKYFHIATFLVTPVLLRISLDKHDKIWTVFSH